MTLLAVRTRDSFLDLPMLECVWLVVLLLFLYEGGWRHHLPAYEAVSLSHPKDKGRRAVGPPLSHSPLPTCWRLLVLCVGLDIPSPLLLRHSELYVFISMSSTPQTARLAWPDTCHVPAHHWDSPSGPFSRLFLLPFPSSAVSFIQVVVFISPEISSHSCFHCSVCCRNADYRLKGSSRVQIHSDFISSGLFVCFFSPSTLSENSSSYSVSSRWKERPYGLSTTPHLLSSLVLLILWGKNCLFSLSSVL